MLIDRSAPEAVFARVPELAEQTDPVLVQLDRLLDEDGVYQPVRGDLARRSRLTAVHGRHSPPGEVVLRLLAAKQLYGWSSAETVQRVADSLVLRWSCAGAAACTSGARPPPGRCCAGHGLSRPRRCKPSSRAARALPSRLGLSRRGSCGSMPPAARPLSTMPPRVAYSAKWPIRRRGAGPHPVGAAGDAAAAGPPPVWVPYPQALP
jgi:hypothetical protein